jgi:predicted HTH transcriptional regulator
MNGGQMNIVYLVIGLVVGIIIGMNLNKKALMGDCCAPENSNHGVVAEQSEEKEKNLAKIREFIVDKDKVTNEEIQKLLNISDATVARYFDDLEKEGIVKQVGETGQSVYYDIVK